MKRLYLFTGIYIGFAVSLSGCVSHTQAFICTSDSDATNHTNIHSTSHHFASSRSSKVAMNKNPITVAFYPQGMLPNSPYKIIAKESVSQFNSGGIKRQDAVVHDVLRQLAASVGGDAVINIRRDHNKIYGEVVKFNV